MGFLRMPTNPQLLMLILQKSMGLDFPTGHVLVLFHGLGETPHHTLPAPTASKCLLGA